MILHGRALRRSDAALAVVSALPGWRWVRALHVVPRPLRDAFYTLISRHRYRLFGKHDVCDLGGPSLEGRVITDDVTPSR